MPLSDALNRHKEGLLAALEADDRARLSAQLPELRSADIAEILQDLLEREQELRARALLDRLPLERRANVMGYLHGEEQLAIVAGMGDDRLQAVLEEMGATSVPTCSRFSTTIAARRCSGAWRIRSARSSSAWPATRKAPPAR